MTRFALIVAVLAALAVSISPFGALGASLKYCSHPTASDYQRLPHEYPAFNTALHLLWGTHWKEAAIVSFGEGSWSPTAQNGQYLGTFQCGDWCQGKYGTGKTLVTQAFVAYMYWLDSGWSGWDCVSY